MKRETRAQGAGSADLLGGGVEVKSKTKGQQNLPATQVIADSYLSMGYRGKPRLYILVRRCAYCSAPHCHTGKPDFVNGARMASCRGGRYLVHVVTVEVAA